MARPAALQSSTAGVCLATALVLLVVATLPGGAVLTAPGLTASATTPSATAPTSTVQSGGSLSDVTVNASPPIAHQPANWTVQATITRDANVTRIDVALPGDAPENISPSAVRTGYGPPVNATFVMVGHPDSVTVLDDGTLRLTYPGGIEVQNGSRLTVQIAGGQVPGDPARAELAIDTESGTLTGTDSIDPKPVPHIGFHRHMPEPGVHLRYGMARGITMFAVVLHDGEVVGTKYLNAGYAITVDGEGIQVDGVSGTTELTIRAYADVDDNGFFDPDEDRPIVDRKGNPIGQTADIELPTTATETSDAPTTTTSVSHNSPTSSPDESTVTASESTDSPTTADAPGLGVFEALVALLITLLGAVFLVVRD